MKFVRDQVSNLSRGIKAKAIPARNYLFLCGQNITLSVITPRHAPPSTAVLIHHTAFHTERQ